MCDNHKNVGATSETTTAEMETKNKIGNETEAYKKELSNTLKDVENKYYEKEKNIGRFRNHSKRMIKIRKEKSEEIAKVRSDINKKHRIN